MSRIRADRYTNRAGTGAPTFSDGVNVVGITSVKAGAGVTTMEVTGDLSVISGTIKGASELSISGITSSISDTAVDVFVYDTSKDSDGGAWRKRTQNTSWYNETLNTATRGSRREFPAVAVLVLYDGGEALRIYDGDDPDLPMWMDFTNTSGRNYFYGPGQAQSITMLNGMFVTGAQATNFWPILVDFLRDDCIGLRISGGNMWHGANIAGRNTSVSDSSVYWATGARRQNLWYINGYIVNQKVNDVAMTVLPNAPIDDTTGLPIPTIAFGTDGGLSIIKDDGTVVDATPSSSGWNPTTVSTYERNKFIMGTTSTAGGYILPVFNSDTTYNITSVPPSNGWLHFRSNGAVADIFLDLNGESVGSGLPITAVSSMGVGSAKGMNFFDVNDNSHSNSLVAYATTSYNTGWMHGDIKLATLSDTNATNQTGGTVADRSVNNNALNVTGTITRTAVATGAELVAYSGFSNSDYLQQPYNSDLAPGTGQYSVSCWFKTGPVGGAFSDQYIFDRTADNAPRALLLIRPSTAANPNVFQFYHTRADGTGSDLQATDLTGITDNNWHQVVALNDGDRYRVYVDGKQSAITATPIRDVDNTDTPPLWIGLRHSSNNPFGGSLALFRWSNSAPSSEQIKKMYDDEKYLFQENSQATLYGSSDAVTALAYDDTTDLLHVGTSAGRSEFQGLRRINNTTTAVTTALSASNELVAEQ